ncbi:HRDC domain-containing protein, partial [Clostridium perfringens]
LFELLRELRLNISREENVPPYVIFGDGTLKEMTVKYPLDKDSMLDISGVGETKFNKYGERFIEVIKNYVEVNNIKPSNQKDINDNYIEDEEFFEVKSDKELLDRLYLLRSEFAKKERTIPSMIISKNSLKEISGRYPCNDEELKDIAGVGPKKIISYGEEILKEVKRYLIEKDIDRVWKEKKKKRLILD